MKKLILVLIIAIAFFLRVYKLGEYPTGFLWDEAALGYNAYSILKTARDEYGQLLPLIFKSFGDYKPGFYVYLAIPPVAIFGLNEFAVRLPSALFGSLTIFIFYLLVNELLPAGPLRREASKAGINAVFFPLACSTLLAISPWHINFSRGAWELNVMLFELITGLFFLVKYQNSSKRKFLILSAVFFSLTFLTYQSAKFLTPLLLIAFLFFFRKNFSFIKNTALKRFLLIFGVIFILFNLFTLFSGKGGRIKVMSLLSYPRSPSETAMFLNQDNQNLTIFNLFHNSKTFFLRLFLDRYFNHFSGKFLFITGDWSNQRNGVVYQGQMYYLDVLFLLLGLGYLFVKKRNPLDNFMLFWLLLAPVPSALTRDSISSVRSFTMVIPLIYITAIGVVNIINALQGFSLCTQGESLLVSKRRVIFRRFCYLLSAICYLLLFTRFLDLYFTHDPKYTAENRLFGYKQAVEFIKPILESKNKVIFTDTYGQPYIFYLFYSKYDPGSYQKKAKLTENPYGDVGRVESLDNIEFRKIYWPSDRNIKNSLFIGDGFDLPIYDIVGQENITLLKEIKFPNDKTAFRIVETE